MTILMNTKVPDILEGMDEGVDTSAALLALDRVRVEFGPLVAVRDVSFTLRGGELLGLIGPNGAGKTTLLRATTGLQPLAAGQVHVLGERVGPHAIALSRHIGFTPDTPPVYEGLTVREFLRFIAKGYDLDPTEIDERIDFWLEQVWLMDKADQKIKALSRGMRQRIGIARTMLPNPNVILLDEPAAGLDPAGRVQFRQLLCNLRDQSKAIIVSSHILADMNEYCTHIAIMARGSIVRLGTVAQVAAAGDGHLCRYAITLTRPVADLAGLLETMAGVNGVQVERLRATIEYSNCPEDAARLLAELVTRRVPVASFAPLRPDLEEAYLRTGIEQVD
jgi:ABC-2 type transport system ATP-binding protein